MPNVPTGQKEMARFVRWGNVGYFQPQFGYVITSLYDMSSLKTL
jgi:hypothetical protein